MKTSKPPFALLFVLITASLACNLPIMIQGGGDGIPDGLTEDYVPSQNDNPVNSYNFSSDQMTVINTYGNPTRFTIIFTENDRHEIWTYDNAGYMVVFRNGVKLSELNETPQYQEGMYATTLSPNQFYRGMGIDEIVLSAGRDDIHLTTLEGLDEENRLMHLRGLSVGLVNNRVSFVETTPAGTEIKLNPEDFSPAVTLTPEEQSNQGSHLYKSVTNFGDQVLQNDPMTLQIWFENGSAYLSMGEPGDALVFSPVEHNQYQNTGDIVDGELTMIFNMKGFTWQSFQDGQLVEVIHTIDSESVSQAPSEPVPTSEPKPTVSPSVSSLTPEEQAVQGTRAYTSIFYSNRDPILSTESVIQITFADGLLQTIENGEEETYTRIGKNSYQRISEEKTVFLTVTSTGYVWKMDVDNGIIEFHHILHPTESIQGQDTDPASSMTPEEVLNSDKNYYKKIVFEDGAVTEENQVEFIVSFDDNSMQMQNSTGTINYTRIGPNRYVDPDGIYHVVFTNLGIIWQSVEVSDSTLVVFRRLP